MKIGIKKNHSCSLHCDWFTFWSFGWLKSKQSVFFSLSGVQPSSKTHLGYQMTIKILSVLKDSPTFLVESIWIESVCFPCQCVSLISEHTAIKPGSGAEQPFWGSWSQSVSKQTLAWFNFSEKVIWLESDPMHSLGCKQFFVSMWAQIEPQDRAVMLLGLVN